MAAPSGDDPGVHGRLAELLRQPSTVHPLLRTDCPPIRGSAVRPDGTESGRGAREFPPFDVACPLFRGGGVRCEPQARLADDRAVQVDFRRCLAANRASAILPFWQTAILSAQAPNSGMLKTLAKISSTLIAVKTIRLNQPNQRAKVEG